LGETALVWLVQLEVGDLVKVLEVAGKQGQVMLQTRCSNENIQILDLLSDLPGKAASNVGKALHHCGGQGEHVLPFQEGVSASKSRLRIMGKGCAFVEFAIGDNADC
jgi:hypothetical protein